MQKIIDRFVKYVQVDTQSDPNNPEFPSTKKQWDLAHILVDELKEIGMEDVGSEVARFEQALARVQQEMSRMLKDKNYIGWADCLARVQQELSRMHARTLAEVGKDRGAGF